MSAADLCYDNVREAKEISPGWGNLIRDAVRDAAAIRNTIDELEEQIADLVEAEEYPALERKSFVLVGVATESQVDNLEDEFRTLSREWKREAGISSSMSDAAMHESYQRIIGLGPKVIPLIFRDLRDVGGAWFWALRALTGKNPVSPDHRGDFSLMKEDWLNWGRRHGFI